MTVYLNHDIEMLRNLKALYKYTVRFLTIFSLVDTSSRLNRKRLGNLYNSCVTSKAVNQILVLVDWVSELRRIITFAVD